MKHSVVRYFASYYQNTYSQQLPRLYHCNGRKACEAPYSTTARVPVTATVEWLLPATVIVDSGCYRHTRCGGIRSLASFPAIPVVESGQLLRVGILIIRSKVPNNTMFHTTDSLTEK